MSGGPRRSGRIDQATKQRVRSATHDLHRKLLSDQIRASIDLDGLEVGRLAGHLPLVASQLFKKDRRDPADQTGVEALALCFKQLLQPVQTFRFDRLVQLIRAFGAGRARPGEYLKKKLEANSISRIKASVA